MLYQRLLPPPGINDLFPLLVQLSVSASIEETRFSIKNEIVTIKVFSQKDIIIPKTYYLRSKKLGEMLELKHRIFNNCSYYLDTSTVQPFCYDRKTNSCYIILKPVNYFENTIQIIPYYLTEQNILVFISLEDMEKYINIIEIIAKRIKPAIVSSLQRKKEQKEKSL